MMQRRRYLFSFIIALILAINLLPMAEASGNVCITSLERPQFLAASSGGILPTALCEELKIQFQKCNETINIHKYRLPLTKSVTDAMINFVYQELTEAFHVLDMDVEYSAYTGLITGLRVTYSCSATEYNKYLAECKAAAEELLVGIKGNSSLGDVERALLVHDRLILHCEYDYDYATSDTTLLEAFSMYGALVEGRAVCQGYTAAYDYLLEQLGMSSRFCVSDTLDHCWNIIEINGTEYHVDTTWDDPTYYEWNLKGEVYHDFFLNSDERSMLMHETSDFTWINANSAHDKKYDNYFWKNSYSAFILLDDEIYYIDHSDQVIRAYSTRQSIESVADSWKGSGISFARLDGFDGYLYYNTAEKIFELDPQNGKGEQILSPTLQRGELIYGFTVEDHSAVYDLSIDPNASVDAFRRKSDVILPYTDLQENAWYKAGVRYVYRNGLMVGTTSSTFAPEATMTRAMLVTVLYRLSGSPTVSGVCSFSDVEENQWYFDAVLWASQNNLVNGMNPTTFAPNDAITRVQMVTLLYRYTKMQGDDVSAEGNLSGFADRNLAPDWATDALDWAVGKQLVVGISEGGQLYFYYNNPTTRTQVATLLMRYLQK